mgnify:CR=1 FL=1
MKKLLCTLLGLLFGATTSVQSQNQTPIEWRFAVKKTSANTYNIHLTALIDQPWKLYTKLLNGPEGHMLAIDFNHNAYIILSKDMQELGVPIEEYSPRLNAWVRYYKIAANFVQKVTLIVDEPVTINGTIDYLVGRSPDQLENHREAFEITINE